MKYLIFVILLTSCCSQIPQHFQAEVKVSTISANKEITCHTQKVSIEYTNRTFSYQTFADTITLTNLGFVGPNAAESYPYLVTKGNLRHEPYLFGITNIETKETIVIGHECFKLN